MDSPLVRLRVSIHVGPLSLPRHRGDAINDSARLLNSQAAARQALAAAADNGGFLAAVVSELAYDYTVQAGRTPDFSEHHFLEAYATVSDKPGYQAPCRVHVPNLTGLALRPYLADTDMPSPASPAAGSSTAAAPSAGGTFNFHKELHDPTIANTIENLRIDPAASADWQARSSFPLTQPWSTRMPETPYGHQEFDPVTPPTRINGPGPNGDGRWHPPADDDVNSQVQDPAGFPSLPAPLPPADGGPDAPIRESAGGDTHLYGSVEVVAHTIGRLEQSTIKRELLDGSELIRAQLLAQPFVRSVHWGSVWEQAVVPDGKLLRQPVTIIVAPRSYGSTTFAQRLMAEHTGDHTQMVKLDPDWNVPSRGRLPVEPERAYQMDLKHPENDQLSADFLDSLSQHAAHLRASRSYLVLTVAQSLWTDPRLSGREGIQVLRLQEPPDAEQLVDAHLRAYGFDQLAGALRSLPKATAALRGMNAVAAELAVQKVVLAWKEPSPQEASAAAEGESETELEERITAALTDWRDELDDLFGEMTSRRDPNTPSLPVEDRCLLLALAVRQSAPMPDVAGCAAALLEGIGYVPALPDASAGPGLIPTVLAGRGLRRRVREVGARVDMQDTVVFDRPAYGRAVLEYVWDNYDVMREPLLKWLAATAQNTDADDRAVDALAQLTVRHDAMGYLTLLGGLVRDSHPKVLGAVMESAVRNEHIGRLAWEALYRWAGQDGYAPTVVELCRRILEDATVAASHARRAMVRLRRVAHKAGEPTSRQQVLDVFEELAQQPAAVRYLVDEVRAWQTGKVSARSGCLAFLALMGVERDGGSPSLLSMPDIDVRTPSSERTAAFPGDRPQRDLPSDPVDP